MNLCFKKRQEFNIKLFCYPMCRKIVYSKLIRMERPRTKLVKAGANPIILNKS